MHLIKVTTILIILYSTIQQTVIAAHQNLLKSDNIDCANCDLEQNIRQIRSISKKGFKRDMFISRGWGAAGMPFSILYLYPSSRASNAPTIDKTTFYKQSQQRKQQQKNLLPQLRMAMPNRGRSGAKANMNRTPHSVIPQLFVSYGWGPLGRK